MPLTYSDFIEGDSQKTGEVTDNYMHPGWNLKQAFTVIGLTTATIAALLTAQCTKTYAENNRLQEQSQSEKIIPENSLTQ